MKIVFDTYAWIEYFKGSEEGKIAANHLTKNEIITPSVVLLELSYKADLEKWNMKDILNFIKINSKIVGYNDDFVLKFGNIYNEAKKKIKSIGIADCIILTTARLNEARVLTGDPHFKGFSETIMLN